MKLTAKIQIVPDNQQRKHLLDTLKTCNNACNYISEYAFANKLWNKRKLQKAIYHEVKSKFNLSAQITILCIEKVSYSYRTDKKVQHVFKKYSSIAFDSRVLTYKPTTQQVSIWTINGREKVPYLIGERQKELLKHQKGESDLCFIKGKFYIHATCEIPDKNINDFNDVIGIDLGITNIAVTSDGKKYSSDKIESNRKWYAERRAKLQRVGTKSAKRRLKKLSKRESNFKRNINHCISKEIVALAKDTHRAIGLEDLTHIRKRTTVRKEQRARHSSWAFRQLRDFIAYKAQMNGVKVIYVNPRNTSRTCPVCNHCEKANRKNQSKFVCKQCGYSNDADVVGAINIRNIGVSHRPYGDNSVRSELVASPPALAVGN